MFTKIFTFRRFIFYGFPIYLVVAEYLIRFVLSYAPVLLEAVASIGAALVGATVAATVTSLLKGVVKSKERIVSVKFPSGKVVHLELDSHLSTEAASALATDAVHSVESGDEAAVQRTVEASRIASREARLVSADP